jgi:hypothetical protein
LSNDPKRFIFKSLSRNISSQNKKRGWSDCPAKWAGPSVHLTDCPPVRRGTSARVESACGGTGGSDANNGPSTPGAGPSSVHLADCPRVRRGLPAGGSRSRGDKSITLPCSSQTARAFLHISLSLSLPLSQGRTPSWGFCLGHSPNCLSTSPDSPRGSPPYHPGVFSHISFSLSDFEQEGDYGLMM